MDRLWSRQSRTDAQPMYAGWTKICVFNFYFPKHDGSHRMFFSWRELNQLVQHFKMETLKSTSWLNLCLHNILKWKLWRISVIEQIWFAKDRHMDRRMDRQRKRNINVCVASTFTLFFQYYSNFIIETQTKLKCYTNRDFIYLKRNESSLWIKKKKETHAWN